jgi:hypothetical protein
MSKMVSYCSIKHLTHKLWSKEGSRVKLPVWLPTRKSREWTRFTYLQRTCDIPLENSRQELQFFFRLHLDPRSSRKIMGLQSHGSLHWRDFETPTRESWERKTYVVSHRVYYKREGGGFPQVRAVVSFVCPCCPWLVLAQRVLQLCINHLVWVVCRPMWVIEACQLFLVPSRSSNTRLYPSKCWELGNVPRLLFVPLFPTWAHIWVLWGIGSASNWVVANSLDL